MYSRTVVDKTKQILQIEISGCVYENDARRVIESILADKRLRLTTKRLWNLSGADLSTLDTASIESLAEYTSQLSGAGEATKVAVVVTTEVGRGLMRMYQAVSTVTSSTFALFKNVEEAETWLQES